MKETEWKCYPIPGWPWCTSIYLIASPAAITNRLIASLPHNPLLSFVVLNKGKVGTQPKLLTTPLSEGAERDQPCSQTPQGMIEQRPNMD